MKEAPFCVEPLREATGLRVTAEGHPVSDVDGDEVNAFRGAGAQSGLADAVVSLPGFTI